MTRLSENRTRKTSSLSGPRAGARRQANGRSSGKRAAGAVAEPVVDGSAEIREKEGGQLPDLNGFAVRQGIVAGPVPRPVNAPVSDPLLAMRARFLSDFAEWLIGRHPDTYKPRERIMRQWTEASRLHGSPTQHR
jgi:hypothetical protein